LAGCAARSPINAAEAERSAAKAELANLPEPSHVTAAEIYARIDMISELGASLSSAQLRTGRATRPSLG
jgi:hypothetical protein